MVGIEFTPVDIEVDENHFANNPEQYVIQLSEKKALEAARKIGSGIIAAADTIVHIEGQILNKPVDAADASRMLRLLSGRIHQVYTGYTILRLPDMKKIQHSEETDVTFRELTDEEINDYIATGAPFDKAGSYGIQDDLSALFVERIDGCFFNVVGLPLSRFYLSLRQFADAEKTSR